MTIWNPPTVSRDMDTKQLANLVAELIDDISFIMNGNIDSRNTREIGGYTVGLHELMSKSGEVGLSSIETAADDIRIWAGSSIPEAAPFRVYESGRMEATNGYFTGDIVGSLITGGTIQTTPPNTYPRIELSSAENLLTAESSPFQSVTINASYMGGSPAIFFDDQEGITIMLSASGSLSILPSKNLYLNPANSVYVPSWSRLVNASTNRTLQQDLDALVMT